MEGPCLEYGGLISSPYTWSLKIHVKLLALFSGLSLGRDCLGTRLVQHHIQGSPQGGEKGVVLNICTPHFA